MKKNYFLLIVISLLSLSFVQAAESPGKFRKKMPEKKLKASTALQQDETRIVNLQDSSLVYDKNDNLVYKDYYTYDKFGNIVLEESYEWDKSRQVWVGEYKESAGYDDANRRIWEESYDWDETGNQWVVESRRENEYNSRGDVTEYRYYDVENGQLLLTYKFSFSYNYNHRETAYESYGWDSGQNKWYGSEKWLVRVDDKGNQLYRENYNWQTEKEAWQLVEKQENKYDSEDRIIYESSERLDYDWWGSMEEIWYKYRSTFEFDANGNLVYSEYLDWNPESQEWDNGNKEIIQYDANNQVILRETYQWDKNAWTGSWKTTYEYSNQKPVLELSFSWNENQWVNAMKTEYLYDADGRNEHTDYYEWSVFEWRKYSKSEFEYDADGLQTELVYWGSDYAGWFPGTKNSSKKDDAGNVYFFESYDWNSESEEFTGREKYSFVQNSDGQVLLEERYEWDFENKQWYGYYKQVRDYNASGYEILSESYEWDNQRNDWIGSYKTTTEFDSQDRTTFYGFYNWDYANHTWLLVDKSNHDYDSDGNEISYDYYSLDRESNQWIGIDKYTAVFDSDRNEIESIEYEWENGNWVFSSRYTMEYEEYGQVYGEMFIWNKQTSAWEKDEYAHFYYSPKEIQDGGIVEPGDGIEDIQEDKIRIYCKDGMLYVEYVNDLRSVTVYSAGGARVVSSPEGGIPVHSFNKGVYIVQVVAGEGIITRKIYIP